MTKSPPSKKIAAWKREPILDRFSKCAAMLAIHGFVTAKERERIHKRMMKWVAKCAENDK